MLDIKKSSGSILGSYLDTPRTPRESIVDTSESRRLSEARLTDVSRNSESRQIKKDKKPSGCRINEVEALRDVFFTFFLAKKSD